MDENEQYRGIGMITEALKDYAHFILAVTDMMPAVVMVVALPSRDIIYTNYDMIMSLGFDADEIPKMSFADRIALIHPDDLSRIEVFYKRFSAISDEEENSAEYRLKNKMGEWVFVSTVGKVFRRDEDKMVTQVLLVARDVTKDKKAEQELNERKELLHSISDVSLTSIASYNAVKDEKGQIIDFEYVFQNKANRQYHGGECLGKRMTEVVPGVKEDGTLAMFVRTLETGSPEALETRHDGDGHNCWVRVTAVKIGDGIVSTAEDITESKNAEQGLKYNQELLQATIDSSPDRIHVVEAVRNEKSEITDFRWILSNNSAREKYGDLVGDLMTQRYPSSIELGVFDACKRVTETGIPLQLENHFVLEGVDVWLQHSLVKLKDGVVDTTRDITDRKKAEQEILRLKGEMDKWAELR